MESKEKPVDFHKYCQICEHRDLKETDVPCADCLEEPSNTDSEKPANFEPRV